MIVGRRVSLQARQLLAVTLGLVAFLGLTGYALDRAFSETAERSLQDRLRSYAFAYLAGSDISRGGIFLPPETPPDPRFNLPGSGLYAAVIGDTVQWQPPSSIGQELPLELELDAPQERFEGPLRAEGEERPGQRVYRYARGVIWEQDGQELEHDFTFFVFEDARVVGQQIAVFRRALWGYLGAAVLLLLGVQIVVLQWSLLPLKRVERELGRVQSGAADQLSERHPRELAPLTGAINALVRSEREQMERHRKTLADLAHSLKTPLAVLRTRLESTRSDGELREEVELQVQRMNDIVSYQLARAAATGHTLFAAPLEIAPKAEQIVQSLEKLHADKGAYCEFDIDEGARFHGELGDMMELVGNLLENAFKWCRRRVLLTVRDVPDPAGLRAGLALTVEDDGAGIPPERVDSLLQRGVRGDERVQGHGIGLAIVQDIVRAYRGELSVSRSEELGGARFHVTLPPGL